MVQHSIAEFHSVRTLHEIEHAIEKYNLSKDKITVCYCRTAILASITAIILEAAGFKQVKVYDGSWTEYGSKPE